MRKYINDALVVGVIEIKMSAWRGSIVLFVQMKMY